MNAVHVYRELNDGPAIAKISSIKTVAEKYFCLCNYN